MNINILIIAAFLFTALFAIFPFSKYDIILFFISIILWIWLLIYELIPWQVERQILLKPTTIGNSYQVIAFTDSNNKPVIINVNDKFKRIIDKYEYVEVSICKKGPYLGLYSNEPHEEYTIKKNLVDN
jgi:hypothetical protein